MDKYSFSDFGMDEKIAQDVMKFVDDNGRNAAKGAASILKTLFIAIGDDLPVEIIEGVLNSYAETILYKYITGKDGVGTLEQLFNATYTGDEDNAD